MNNASSENDGLPHFSPQDLDSKLKLWCTTVAAVVTALAVYFFATRQSEKKYQYPLPPYCTCGFFETLQSFNSTKFHEWVLNLTRTQGRILEINLWPLVPAGVHFFQVNDPKVARKILENPKALKAREGYEFFDRLVGGICFISEEGERYKHPRKSTLMGMSHSNVDNMISKINDVMDKWIADNLGKNKGDVVDVDIGVEMQKATVYCIGKIAFGYDFSKEEQEETLNKLMKTTYEFGIACEQNPLRKNPILGLLWADKREATGFVQDLRFLLRKVLETHRKKCVAEQKKAVALDEMDKPEKYEAFDGDEGLISDMLLLYAAGFDTTGYTISYALLELAKNPEVQKQLREELRRTNMLDSALLKRVVKETLRLWPVAASGGLRQIPEEMVVSSDDGNGGKRLMTLPKNSIAHVATYCVLRDEEGFDRADEWIPERWENPSQDMKTAFMPFMVGRRSCPGQLLAQTESEVFLARLVKDYEWSLVKETEPEFTVTLKIKGTILQAKTIF